MSINGEICIIHWICNVIPCSCIKDKTYMQWNSITTFEWWLTDCICNILLWQCVYMSILVGIISVIPVALKTFLLFVITQMKLHSWPFNLTSLSIVFKDKLVLLKFQYICVSDVGLYHVSGQPKYTFLFSQLPSHPS